MATHLHFHLGPVGGFIAESRRTRDYWAGSFLLSWLVGHAIADVRKEGGKIILPVVEKELPPKAEPRFGWAVLRREGRRYEVDPTLAAIENAAGAALSHGPFLGTLTNHFTAEFKERDPARQAGEGAANAVRTAWKRLADEVLQHVLDRFSFRPADAERALSIWNRQIGDHERSPVWEIYWVAAPDTGALLGEGTPLELRKLTRWSLDMQAELPENGNLCTLFGRFIDVSGLERRQENQDVRQFWAAVRSHLNKVRYNTVRYGEEVGSDAACLDLRPNESLCAPALVKRLFPLLAARGVDRLGQAIGWKPDLRNEMPKVLETQQWLVRISQLWRKATEPPPETHPDPDREVDLQSALLWPSTSYIAATHWIARAQRSVPGLCREFEVFLKNFGRQYAVAEQSLWLRAVHEPFTDDADAALAWVDGAMLHSNRLELAEGRDIDARRVDARGKALSKLKEIQNSRAIRGDAERSYWHDDMKVGRPPSYYAIIRADGDSVGSRLGSAKTEQERQAISTLLSDWARAMRGNAQGSDREAKFGPVAGRNGVLLYAGADELLVFAPAEDAFDIACAIQQSFEDRSKQLASSATPGARTAAPITLSVSVLYAHIRAPLRWAIHESLTLLDDVAKKATKKNALALAVFDVDGVRSRWAAQWGSMQIEAFGRTLKMALEQHSWLWSNEFYHRLADSLRAFLVPFRDQDYPDLVKYLADDRKGGRGRPMEDLSPLAEKLVAACIAQKDRAAIDAVAPSLFSLLTPFDPNRRPQKNLGHLNLAPLDILRVLGANWRKDNDGYAPVRNGAGQSEDAA